MPYSISRLTCVVGLILVFCMGSANAKYHRFNGFKNNLNGTTTHMPFGNVHRVDN